MNRSVSATQYIHASSMKVIVIGAGRIHFNTSVDKIVRTSPDSDFRVTVISEVLYLFGAAGEVTCAGEGFKCVMRSSNHGDRIVGA